MDASVLIAIACLFAFVSGMNDGGALLATGLKLPAIRPAVGTLTLVVLMALVPLVTHQVARTFVTRLATFQGPGAKIAMTVAVAAALIVVMTLSAKGLPTASPWPSSAASPGPAWAGGCRSRPGRSPRCWPSPWPRPSRAGCWAGW